MNTSDLKDLKRCISGVLDDYNNHNPLVDSYSAISSVGSESQSKAFSITFEMIEDVYGIENAPDGKILFTLPLPDDLYPFHVEIEEDYGQSYHIAEGDRITEQFDWIEENTTDYTAAFDGCRIELRLKDNEVINSNIGNIRVITVQSVVKFSDANKCMISSFTKLVSIEQPAEVVENIQLAALYCIAQILQAVRISGKPILCAGLSNQEIAYNLGIIDYTMIQYKQYSYAHADDGVCGHLN